MMPATSMLLVRCARVPAVSARVRDQAGKQSSRQQTGYKKTNKHPSAINSH
jgi:hypothetical protein